MQHLNFYIMKIIKLLANHGKNNPKAGIWGIHLVFWILIISSLAYFTALSFDGMFLLRRLLIIVAGNIILFYTCYSWIFPEFILKKRIFTGLLLFFLVVLIVVVTRHFSEEFLFDKFNRQPEFLIPARRRFFLMFIGEGTFAGFAGLIRTTVNNYENKKRMDELKNLQLNTELQFLKSQINPHFLFNSINNIYSLSLMKSDKAPESLMKLSELLHYLLYDCHKQVTLSQELDAIHSYIDLFQLKFEEKLNISLVIDDDQLDFFIEPLLFIPLIENAFKYSGIGITQEAFIKIHLYREDNQTVFHIFNSKGFYNKEQSASGIGLPNIKKRLEIIYPGKYTFINNETDEIFEVILKVQLI